MEEMHESRERKTRTAKRRPSNVPRVLGFVFLLLAWGGLTFAGYWYAKQYVEQTAREIQEPNALNVQMLEEKIETLQIEMNAIEEALAQTDKTLSHTGSASEAVNQRITELDKQLNQLEKSLNILMESGNADY